MYQYIKTTPKRPIRRPIMVSFLLMGIGGAMLLWVSWPIVSFTIFTAPLFASVVTPIAEKQGAVANFPGTVPQALAVDQGGGVSDLTNANAWFPSRPQKKVVTPVNSYTLSIPKLTIKNALVVIAGDDLNHNLVHYGGTGLPGEYGNAVVFGHSVLPQFFDPKNYKTIFSTLPTLKEGDDIYVTYDGITYHYLVDNMIVRDPTDLAALEQKYDDSYLTLITCVPPGTYWKRLNVEARLVRM